MLFVHKIKIENFACFRDIEIRPSIEHAKPLTVIRAENGSGKTTLLRAIRWGMYGERSLPGDARHFSVHPAGWNPNEMGIETRVSILFSTDGSTRNHPESQGTDTQYEVNRSVRTIAQAQARQGDPNFRRIDENAELLVKQRDGSWDTQSAGPERVISELLPIELQDFFVMDADEATDFVGGSENKTVSPSDVVKKTSKAIASLLGLELFRSATQQIKKIDKRLGRAATKAIGDKKLNEQQSDLDRYRSQMDELTSSIENNRKETRDLTADLDQTKVELDHLVGSFSLHEHLQKDRIENEQRKKRANESWRKEKIALSFELSSMDLFCSLVDREINQVRDDLQPLYDDGFIPMRHLDFVQTLLDNGRCVCGQDLVSQAQFRRNVENILTESRNDQTKANFLALVLDATKVLRQFQDPDRWDNRCRERERNIGDLDEELSNIEQKKRSIESQLDNIDDEKLSLTRNKISSLEEKLGHLERAFALDQNKAEQLRIRINELEASILSQRKRKVEARRIEAYQNTAKVLIDILEEAYSNIRDRQVRDLGIEMNRLFAEMAVSVFDDDAAEGELHRTPLRMIENVGLRALADAPEEFEIFALNSQKRSMPPTEINGASRRILALSFVLALCKVSGTNAPLIADSLLNFTSGAVRTNTLRVTAETASQPILLLTGSDLESESEVEIVNRLAGATYTLTGQWQHITRGGDVVNQKTEELVSLVCSCGPRQFCDVCERVGQSGNSTWTRVENGGRYA